MSRRVGRGRPTPSVYRRGWGEPSTDAAVVPASVAPAAASIGGAAQSQDLPPTTPTGLTSSDIRPTEVDLTWMASTDDVGISRYEIVIRPA